LDLQPLLALSVDNEASDIHIKAGSPPFLRVDGALFEADYPRLSPTDVVEIAFSLMDEKQAREFHETNEADFAYSVAGLGRFRANIFKQRGTIGISIRRVLTKKIPTFEELGAPGVCETLAEKDRGLVLVVGAAGNGKSSTLAAMVGHMNRTMSRHVITIEDPIEFLHIDDKCSVSQREIGLDTGSFTSALRAALRQDPDVIQVGEIRDGETMEIALQAAETGHLVLSTLHTPDVVRTMNRIIALVERSSDDIRDRISDSLQGIIAQRLLPRADRPGLVLAAEVLIATGSVRESIRRPQGNPPLKELMENGGDLYGMQTFEMHIKRLVREGYLEREVARAAIGF